MSSRAVKMQGIKNMVFDLGGVILDIDMPTTQKAFEQLGVEHMDRLFGIGKATSVFLDHEKGNISDDDFIAALIALSGQALTKDQVISAWNALLIDFPEERITLLKKLKDRYRLFLFSNTNAIHLEAFQQMFQKKFNASLDALFEKVYYSHLIGFRKPDVAAFEFILNDSQLSPAETLFIDDAKVNIEGAQAVRMKTLYLEKGMDIVGLFEDEKDLPHRRIIKT